MKQRATRRNSLLGRLFGSKTTYRRTRTVGGGRRTVTESPRAAREREAERLQKKFSDAQLDRKLKAHYAKGGSLREFMAMNPAVFKKAGPYSEYSPAHEKALKLQSAGAKSIRIDKTAGRWWITYAEYQNPGAPGSTFKVQELIGGHWVTHSTHPTAESAAREVERWRARYSSRQYRMNPGAPGSAFQRCVESVTEKGGAYDPRAVCASAGRKKYGVTKFASMSAAGKRRAAGRKNAAWTVPHELYQAARGAGYASGEDAAMRGLSQGGIGKEFTSWYEYRKSTIPGLASANKAELKVYFTQEFKRAYKALGGRKNPAAAAAEAYEEFHGTPSRKTTEITERVHFHEHLSEIGRLELLVVAGIDGYEHRISGFNGAQLCENETHDQLFIRGGDQEIDLKDFGIKRPHEVETLGEVIETQYFTTKKHLGSEGGTAIYFHKAGTTSENGRHKKVGYGPDLIYRVRDKALEFSGGTYEIRAEGIDK